MIQLAENSGSTFIPKGGELEIKVKSNVVWEFKFENDNDWLGIINKSGETVTTISGRNNSPLTITCKENDDSIERICSGFCTSEQYEGPDAWVLFKQLPHYFYIEGGSAYTDNNITSAGTTTAYLINTSYKLSDITVTVEGDTSMVSSYDLQSTSFIVTYAENEITSPKSVTFTFKNTKNRVIGILYANQQAGESKSFLWENSATTYTVTATSESSVKTVRYTTNYQTLDFVGDGTVVTNVTDNDGSITFNIAENTNTARTGYVYAKDGNNIVGTLILEQEGQGGEDYFKWSNGQTADTVNVGSAADTSGISYDTTYQNVTFECDGTIVTSVEKVVGRNDIRFTYSNNTGEESRNGYVYAKNGEDTVGVLTVHQYGQVVTYFFNWYNGSTAITATSIGATVTSFSSGCSTNYSVNDLTFVGDGIVVTGGSINNNRNLVTIYLNENTATTATAGTLTVLDNENRVVGTMYVEQEGQGGLFFKWSNGQTADTTSVGSAASSSTMLYETNYSDITFKVDNVVIKAASGSDGILVFSYYENVTPTIINGYISAVTNNDIVVAVLTVEQEGQGSSDYFYWTTNYESADTAFVGSEASGTFIEYETTYSNLVFIEDGNVVTGVSENSGKVTFEYGTNTDVGVRDGSITVKNGNDVVGLLLVRQAGGTDYYFEWDNGTTLLVVSASSSDTITTQLFRTNIPNLTKSYTGIINGVDINMEHNTVTISFPMNSSTAVTGGSVDIEFNGEVVGSVNITQGGQRYFYWDGGVTTITGTVESAQTVFTATCDTNVDNFVFTPNGFVITGSINSDCTVVTVTFDENPSTEIRNGSLAVQDGEYTVGVINLKQNPRSYHFDWVEHGPTWVTTVGSGDTAFTAEYYSDYPSISFVGDSNVTSIDDSVPDYMTVYFTANPSVIARPIRVSAVTNNEVVGELELTQEPQPPYFNWNGGGSAYTDDNITSASTSFNLGFSTNLSHLTKTFDGFICGATINPDDYRIDVVFLQNTGTTDRSGTIEIWHYSDKVGELTLVQRGKMYFNWNDTPNFITIANVSANDTQAIKNCTTNVDNFAFDWDGTVVTAGTPDGNREYIIANLTQNPTFTHRIGWLTVKDNDIEVGKIQVEQSAQTPYFEFYDPGMGEYVPSIRTSVGKMDTELTLIYRTNYDLSNINFVETDGHSYISEFDKSTPNKITIKFGQNLGGTRTILASVYTLDNVELADIEITQLGT